MDTDDIIFMRASPHKPEEHVSAHKTSSHPEPISKKALSENNSPEESTEKPRNITRIVEPFKRILTPGGRLESLSEEPVRAIKESTSGSSRSNSLELNTQVNVTTVEGVLVVLRSRTVILPQYSTIIKPPPRRDRNIDRIIPGTEIPEIDYLKEDCLDFLENLSPTDLQPLPVQSTTSSSSKKEIKPPKRENYFLKSKSLLEVNVFSSVRKSPKTSTGKPIPILSPPLRSPAKASSVPSTPVSAPLSARYVDD